MTPSEIFAHLPTAAQRHGEARDALYELLKKLRSSALKAISRVTEDRAEDALHDSWAVLYAAGKGGRLPVGMADGQCANYCKRTLRNKYLDLLDDEEGNVEFEERAHDRAAVALGGDPSPEVSDAVNEMGGYLARLDVAFESWVVTMAEKDHSGYRRDWLWLKDLYWQRRSMADLVAEMIKGGELDAAMAKGSVEATARTRIYKRHQRVRDYLAAHIERTLAGQDAEELRRALLGLVRCQRTKGRDVSLAKKGR